MGRRFGSPTTLIRQVWFLIFSDRFGSCFQLSSPGDFRVERGFTNENGKFF
jgi:hypothetical protein